MYLTRVASSSSNSCRRGFLSQHQHITRGDSRNPHLHPPLHPHRSLSMLALHSNPLSSAPFSIAFSLPSHLSHLHALFRSHFSTTSASSSSSSSSTSTSSTSTSSSSSSSSSSSTPNGQQTPVEEQIPLTEEQQQQWQEEDEFLTAMERDRSPRRSAWYQSRYYFWVKVAAASYLVYLAYQELCEELEQRPEIAAYLLQEQLFPTRILLNEILPHYFYSTVTGKRRASQCPELFTGLFSVLDDPNATQDEARAVATNLFALSEVDESHIEFAGRIPLMLQLCMSPDKETSCFATMTLTKAVTHPLIRREFIHLDGLRYISRLTRSIDPDVKHYGEELLGEMVREWPDDWNVKAVQKTLDKNFDVFKEAIFNLGGMALDMGMWAFALLAFERLLTMDPSNATAYWCRGQAQEKLGFHSAARDSFKKCTDMHPGHPEAAHLLLSHYVKHEPNNIDGMMDAVDRVMEGIKALQRQLKLGDPSAPINVHDLNVPNILGQCYFMLVNALEKLGRMDEALVQSLEWSLIMPRNGQARFTHGRLLVKDRHYRQAIEELRAASALDPNKGEPLYQLALAHYKFGREQFQRNKISSQQYQQDLQQAITFIKQACQIVNFDPETPDAPMKPIVKKKYEGAMMPVSVLLPPPTQPSDPALLIPACVRLLSRVEIALANIPTTPQNDVNMHYVHAFKYTTTYLKKRPRDIDIQLQQAELLSKLGDTDGAYQTYQHIVKVWMKHLPREKGMIPNQAVKKFFAAPERHKQQEAYGYLQNVCQSLHGKASSNPSLNDLCSDLSQIRTTK